MAVTLEARVTRVPTLTKIINYVLIVNIYPALFAAPSYSLSCVADGRQKLFLAEERASLSIDSFRQLLTSLPDVDYLPAVSVADFSRIRVNMTYLLPMHLPSRLSSSRQVTFLPSSS